MDNTDLLPCRCPVCNGSGLVPFDFYNPTPTMGLQINVRIACKACKGKGILDPYRDALRELFEAAGEVEIKEWISAASCRFDKAMHAAEKLLGAESGVRGEG